MLTVTVPPAGTVLTLWLAGVGFLAIAGLTWTTSFRLDVVSHLVGLVGGAAAGALLAPAPGDRSRGGGAAAQVSLSAIALAAAGLRLLPKPIDLAEPLGHYARTEVRLAARTAELTASAREGRLSPAAVAAALKEDVIPSWHELRSILPEPDRLGPRQQGLVALLNRHAAAQEELWTLVAANGAPEAIAARAAEIQALRGQLDAHVVKR